MTMVLASGDAGGVNTLSLKLVNENACGRGAPAVMTVAAADGGGCGDESECTDDDVEDDAETDSQRLRPPDVLKW